MSVPRQDLLDDVAVPGDGCDISPPSHHPDRRPLGRCSGSLCIEARSAWPANEQVSPSLLFGVASGKVPLAAVPLASQDLVRRDPRRTNLSWLRLLGIFGIAMQEKFL